MFERWFSALICIEVFNNIRAVRKFCAMESCCFGSEGKGFVLSDEMVSPSEALVNSQTVLMGWNLKSQCDYENTMPVSGYDANENEGVMEVNFSNVIRKSLPSNPIGGFLCAKIGSEKVSSPTCIFSSKEFFREKDSGSMLLSSVLDFESRKSSLVDLKLGRLADYRDSLNCKSSKTASILSSVPSCVPEKRVRMASFTSQTPLCQVHGCSMDLSNSKEYHKRHKVCAVHSKTAKVIVNDIEQRFCQQCSRFHLLAEFDDGKRSCRKRLAGHNERRRKPQLHNHSGGRFPRNALPTRSSLICPDKCPNSILQPVKYETSSWFRHVKLEDESIYSPQSSVPIMNEHFLLKSAPLYGVDKQYPALQGFGFCATSESISNENRNQWPHYLSSPNSITHSVLKSSSSGSEDFTVFDSASTLQGFPRVSDSSSALSLLSPHSHNSSSHPSGIPMAQPLILQGGHNYSTPESILGIISQASTCLASNRFSSSGVNTLKVDHLEPVVASDTSNAYSIQVSDFFQGSDFENVQDPLSCGDATKIDLLQLSQLQHVEHQRHSMQMKEENDIFCYLPIAKAL